MEPLAPMRVVSLKLSPIRTTQYYVDDMPPLLTAEGKSIWRYLLDHATTPPVVPSLTVNTICERLSLSFPTYNDGIASLHQLNAIQSPSDSVLSKLSQFRRVGGSFVLLVSGTGDRVYLEVRSPVEVHQALIAQAELIRRKSPRPSFRHETQLRKLRDYFGKELSEYQALSEKLFEVEVAIVSRFDFDALLKHWLNPGHIPYPPDEADLADMAKRYRSRSVEGKYRYGAMLLARIQLEAQAPSSVSPRVLAIDALCAAVDAFEKERAVPRRTHIPESVRREVWRRDGGRCVQCGSQYDLEYDHLIAVINGGSSTARNLRLLCQSCNRSKGAKV